MKKKQELIPFKYIGDKARWWDGNNVYQLNDPDLQKKGLPSAIFDRIKKQGKITEIKEIEEDE